MIQKKSFEEDLELKRFSITPKDKKPRFDWQGVINEDRLHWPEIKVEDASSCECDFNLKEVADAVGWALTNLLLSRRCKEAEIFTKRNQKFVASVAEDVKKHLEQEIKKGHQLKLSTQDINLLIEKTLIENDAHDVARSFVLPEKIVRERHFRFDSLDPAEWPRGLVERSENRSRGAESISFSPLGLFSGR